MCVFKEGLVEKKCYEKYKWKNEYFFFSFRNFTTDSLTYDGSKNLRLSWGKVKNVKIERTGFLEGAPSDNG